MIGVKKKIDRGFTLIEMLVALSIFALAILFMTNIFVTATRSQRQVLQEQKILADLRLTLELLGQQIRRSTIDYSYYQGQITKNPQTVLVLKDVDNNQFRYRFVTEGEGGNLELCTNGVCVQPSDWVKLVADNINLQQVNFYLWPTKDPFALDNAGNYLSFEQPLVTIFFQAQEIGKDQLVPVKIQTTFASRIYRR